jgi:hypothetical protein
MNLAAGVVRLSAVTIWALTLAGGAVGQEAKEKPPPQPGSIAYARLHGPDLLKAQHWQEAAELYGVWWNELRRAVDALDVPPDKTKPAEDLFQFRLATFYFRHMNFARPNWYSAAADILERGKAYQERVKRVPAAEQKQAVDLTCLDVLAAVDAANRKDGITQADRTRARQAIKDHPESLPALAAYLLTLCPNPYSCSNHRDDWAEARRLLTTSTAKLALARTIASYRVEIDAELRGSILNAGAALAPTPEEKAYLYWEEAQLLPPDRELTAVTRIYDLFPSTASAALARQRAAALVLDAEGPAAALTLVRKLKKLPQHDGASRALYIIAAHHFKNGQTEPAKNLFIECANDASDPATAAESMLALAELFHKAKDAKQEMEWLKRCAATPRPEPVDGRSKLDFYHPRNRAISILARRYEAQKDWREALRLWQAWEPSHPSSGTSTLIMLEGRQARIHLCQAQLGEHAAIARDVRLTERACRLPADHSIQHYYNTGLATDAAARLVRIYRQAGQAKDLRLMVAKLEETALPIWKKAGKEEEFLDYAPTGRIKRLIEIGDLGDKKDVPALVDLGRKGKKEGRNFREYEPDWEMTAVVEALTQCGGTELEPLLKLARESEKDRHWAVYALAHSQSPKATPALAGLVEKAERWDMQNLAYALWLRGAEGRPILEKLAKEGPELMPEAAAQYLKVDAQSRQESAPPPAARGSLPRAIPKEGDEK